MTGKFFVGLKLICGFFYHSHPVNKVELVATIVGIVKHEQRIIFTLDDASARIECINFGNDGEDYTNKPEFDLGTIVKELFRWLEIIKLQKGVYSKPFVLPNHAAIDNVNYTEYQCPQPTYDQIAKMYYLAAEILVIEGFLKAHTKGVIYSVDSKS
ncbi:hypothetical protein C2G38_2142040 [Gigaspora rosea]|uniref:OB domain-containing protein n=1 Tax=Gigaspora rosea TaxID=44941 RepID=A0A397VA75_9GLOM|nr:hypothetical protein C2G38_2142040 [Gigaspora rosea]